MSRNFFNLKCAPDLVAEKIFDDWEKMSEALWIFENLKNQFKPADEDNILIVIGNGTHPVLAGLAAFRTKWECYAIDPALKETPRNVRRLTCFPSRYEDAGLITQDPVIVVSFIPTDWETLLGQIVAPTHYLYEVDGDTIHVSTEKDNEDVPGEVSTSSEVASEQPAPDSGTSV